MKKNLVTRGGLAALAIALLAGCASGPAGGSAGASGQLDLAYFGSPVSAYTQRYVEFC